MITPGKTTFDIRQGATWRQELRLRNPSPPEGDGLPINLTGLKARMQVRESVGSETVLLSASTTDGRVVITALTGVIVITIPATVTAALDLDGAKQTWVADIELYNDGVSPEYVDRIIDAKVRVYPEVTR